MSFDYVFFLGSNSTLSAAEAFVTLQREGFSPKVRIAEQRFLILTLNKELPDHFIDRLGGTTRIATLRAEGKKLWDADEIAALLSPTGSDKLRFGLSALDIPSLDFKKLGFAVKKALREGGIKAKFITPGRGHHLSTAQVLFNRLYEAPNSEMTFLKSGGTYYAAETRQVQDIQAYEKRDTGRPARDARVGMLPPKLAQIMLNLIPSFPDNQPTVLDPFCGTGVVLQEGWLLGYRMAGLDQNEAMVKTSNKNLEWLAQNFPVSRDLFPSVSVHDAQQSFLRSSSTRYDAIVTEPYLGKPITSPLPKLEAERREQGLANLYLSFFKNAREILKKDASMLFILPALRERSTWRLFPTSFLDEAKKLGYALSHVVPNELAADYTASERGTILYARPDALVGRELTLWHIRKPEDQHN